MAQLTESPAKARVQPPPICYFPSYLGEDTTSDERIGVGPDISKIVSEDEEYSQKQIASSPTWRRALIPLFLHRRIAALSGLPYEDEFGRVRPSARSIQAARQLLDSVQLPMPDDVSTDHDGAIRISWIVDNRFLEIVFPYADVDTPFIYHSQDDEYGIDPDLSGATVTRYVDWLQGTCRR